MNDITKLTIDELRREMKDPYQRHSHYTSSQLLEELTRRARQGEEMQKAEHMLFAGVDAIATDLSNRNKAPIPSLSAVADLLRALLQVHTQVFNSAKPIAGNNV